MKRRDAFEIYTNYLLASPTKATATGLSAVLDNQMKHDYISDFLADKSLVSNIPEPLFKHPYGLFNPCPVSPVPLVEPHLPLVCSLLVRRKDITPQRIAICIRN